MDESLYLRVAAGEQFVQKLRSSEFPYYQLHRYKHLEGAVNDLSRMWPWIVTFVTEKIGESLNKYEVVMLSTIRVRLKMYIDLVVDSQPDKKAFSSFASNKPEPTREDLKEELYRIVDAYFVEVIKGEYPVESCKATPSVGQPAFRPREISGLYLEKLIWICNGDIRYPALQLLAKGLLVASENPDFKVIYRDAADFVARNVHMQDGSDLDASYAMIALKGYFEAASANNDIVISQERHSKTHWPILMSNLKSDSYFDNFCTVWTFNKGDKADTIINRAKRLLNDAGEVIDQSGYMCFADIIHIVPRANENIVGQGQQLVRDYVCNCFVNAASGIDMSQGKAKLYEPSILAEREWADKNGGMVALPF